MEVNDMASERNETQAQRRRNRLYAEVVELRERGLTIREIAAEVSVSVGTVHRWLRIYDKAQHDEWERRASSYREDYEVRPYEPPPVKSVNRRRMRNVRRELERYTEFYQN